MLYSIFWAILGIWVTPCKKFGDGRNPAAKPPYSSRPLYYCKVLLYAHQAGCLINIRFTTASQTKVHAPRRWQYETPDSIVRTRKETATNTPFAHMGGGKILIINRLHNPPPACAAQSEAQKPPCIPRTNARRERIYLLIATILHPNNATKVQYFFDITKISDKICQTFIK